MPAWIDAFERKPLLYGKYHVKLNGVKETITFHEFDRMMERYDTVFWLDETIDEVSKVTQQIPQVKAPSLMEQIKSGKLSDKHIDQLVNLFGIKKVQKIKKKINS